MYAALTAFVNDGKLPEPTLEDLAKLLVHFDFKDEDRHIVLDSPLGQSWAEDNAAALIAKLLHQEVDRAYKRGQDDKAEEMLRDLVAVGSSQAAGSIEGRNALSEPSSPVLSDPEAIELSSARARIAELEKRLEITHVWECTSDNAELVLRELTPEERSKHPDGIDCRDAALVLHREQAKRQSARIAELEMALSALAPVGEDLGECPTGTDVSGEKKNNADE